MPLSVCGTPRAAYSHDLGSHSEASTPFTSYSDQWHSSNPNTLETKWMEHKLSGSKLSRLLRSTSQAKRDPRRKPPMSKSSTPATPSDPDAYSPTLHEIKQEAYRTSNSGRALVNDTPEVIVKQEVIEGGASVHDVGEISEQSWEATNPQATSVPPECARNTECNSNDSCGNALPRGLLDPPTGSGSGGGHGQAPGNEPLDFEHVQGLYNLLLLFEATAKNLRDMLAPYLSLFAQHGFLLPGDQFLSSPFPFIHTPASLQPAPPPLPISDLELNYAPDPVFAQHNLPGMYNTIEGELFSGYDLFVFTTPLMAQAPPQAHVTRIRTPCSQLCSWIPNSIRCQPLPIPCSQTLVPCRRLGMKMEMCYIRTSTPVEPALQME